MYEIGCNIKSHVTYVHNPVFHWCKYCNYAGRVSCASQQQFIMLSFEIKSPMHYNSKSQFSTVAHLRTVLQQCLCVYVCKKPSAKRPFRGAFRTSQQETGGRKDIFIILPWTQACRMNECLSIGTII